MPSNAILCFEEINSRMELHFVYSKPLVIKKVRNFFNLIEFLVAGFLRFMNLSNIMDLSYFPSEVSDSSVFSNALKRLLE